MSAYAEILVDEAVNMLRLWREYPAVFARDVLGFEPTDYQLEIAHSVRDNRRTSVASCHGAGKSGTSGRFIVPWFTCTHPDSLAITTAPTFRQVKSILWSNIRTAHSKAKAPLGGVVNSTEWKIGPKWYALGISVADNQGDKFQGQHADDDGALLCVVDEAAGMAETIYSEGINNIITSESCRLLLIGNPTTTSGEFYNSAKVDQSKRRPEDYRFFQISAYDTPNFTETGIIRDDILSGAWREKVDIWRAANEDPTLPPFMQPKYPRPYLVTPDWVADTIHRYGADSIIVKTRVDAIFCDEGMNRLIPQNWLDLSLDAELAPVGHDVWDALDPSEMGDDQSIYSRLRTAEEGGVNFRACEAENKSDHDSLVDLVYRQLEGLTQLPHSITIDAVGVGSTFTSYLAKSPPRRGFARVQIFPFKGNNIPLSRPQNAAKLANLSPQQDPYKDRRSEAAWLTRQLFEQNMIDIDPRDSLLVQELAEWRWKLDKNGRIELESKDDIKERIGRSPDRSDALFMAVEGYTRGKSGGALTSLRRLIKSA